MERREKHVAHGRRAHARISRRAAIKIFRRRWISENSSGNLAKTCVSFVNIVIVYWRVSQRLNAFSGRIWAKYEKNGAWIIFQS